jgi:hypothetical protein
MSKVRVVFAEVEGSDQAVYDAIRSFLQAVGIVPAAAVPIAPAAPAPLPIERASEPEQLPARGTPRASQVVKPRGRPPATAKAAAPASSGTDATTQDGGIRDRILAALTKRPMCSVDLVAAVNASSGSVYTWLKKLREEGVVVTHEDEADGERKNFVVKR